VHGANRLASNSLLEGLVFGARAGRAAASVKGRGEDSEKGENVESEYAPSSCAHIDDLKVMRSSLRKLMWERVGIVRCAESLTLASETLARWLMVTRHRYRTRQDQELKNMITVASLITEAAMSRKGSIGAHCRSDYPDRGEDWGRHITLQYGVPR